MTMFELAILLTHAKFDHLAFITNAVAVMHPFRTCGGGESLVIRVFAAKITPKAGMKTTSTCRTRSGEGGGDFATVVRAVVPTPATTDTRQTAYWRRECHLG